MEMLLNTVQREVGLSIPLDAPPTISMHLTPQEMQRAQAIKAAVDESLTLAACTDFEYAQYALAHAGSDSSLDLILHHIERLQGFRQDYKIQDTLEDGMACINAMTLQQPGELVSIQYLPDQWRCVAFSDWKAFQPKRCTKNNAQQHAIYLKGSYYRLQGLHPTLLAIRAGLVEVVECEGVTLEDNHDPVFTQYYYEELIVPYPKRYKSRCLVNSNLDVTVAQMEAKPYMTQNMRETIQWGKQVDGLIDKHRIPEVFLVPTLELARQRVLECVKELLAARYHYQATFTLPPILLLHPSDIHIRL